MNFFWKGKGGGNAFKSATVQCECGHLFPSMTQWMLGWLPPRHTSSSMCHPRLCNNSADTY